MAGLQRAATSFRKQGSSGYVWAEMLSNQAEGPRPARIMQLQDGAREKYRLSNQPQSMKHSRSDGDLYHHGGEDVKASSNIAALPRSTLSFRRQGSSGVVWDDSFHSGEFNQEVVWDDSYYSAELNQEKVPKQEKAQAALPRSTTSFRRQGSSGAVWDASLFSAELINQEKEREKQDGAIEMKQFEVMPRPVLQRKPSQSKRVVRSYRCCRIEDVLDESIVRIRLCGPRVIGGDRNHRLVAKVGTKPRKDWHQKN